MYITKSAVGFNAISKTEYITPKGVLVKILDK